MVCGLRAPATTLSLPVLTASSEPGISFASSLLGLELNKLLTSFFLASSGCFVCAASIGFELNWLETANKLNLLLISFVLVSSNR